MQKKVKKIPKVERQGWKADELVKEAANEESDDIVRKILRGDETKGEPDQRDLAGIPEYKEIKNEKERAKNK